MTRVAPDDDQTLCAPDESATGIAGDATAAAPAAGDETGIIPPSEAVTPLAWSKEQAEAWTVAATEPALTEAMTAQTVMLEQPARRHTWWWIIALFCLMAGLFCVAIVAGVFPAALIFIPAVLLLSAILIAVPLILVYTFKKAEIPQESYRAEVLQRVYAQRAAAAGAQMSAQMAARQPATVLPKWTTL